MLFRQYYLNYTTGKCENQQDYVIANNLDGKIPYIILFMFHVDTQGYRDCNKPNSLHKGIPKHGLFTNFFLLHYFI